MKVFFPHGGRWRMLQWYEQDEGHQLLMAKRPEGILAAMKAVLSKHEAAEIKGYWEIDVWAFTGDSGPRHRH